jgi:anti-sigma regulatory factor (Ser/Thr protein kinase)
MRQIRQMQTRAKAFTDLTSASRFDSDPNRVRWPLSESVYVYGSQSIPLAPAAKCPFIELRQSLPSKVAAVSLFAVQIMRFILKFRGADGSEIDIQMALREALANAVIHGNGENSYKRVYVDCRCYRDGEVSITVRDEGQGFNGEEVASPTTPENLLFTHVRGIYLMKRLMDEVSFEDGGSGVRMRKNSNGDFSPSNDSKSRL